LCKHLQILHDFWMLCKVPETDEAGRLIQTESRGKLGEKFKQPSGTTQKRARP
jgi:hypothetical protein